MSKLQELIQKLCPDGVEYKKIKDVFRRLKGTPITASKMKEIGTADGEIRIFAGGKTVINAHEIDIPNANITRVPAVLVQSRGIIDVVYYDKPFTFKNEMWAYTANNPIQVKFLYYVLKNNIQEFRNAASGMGALPQISLSVTEKFEIPVPPLEVQNEIVNILDRFADYAAELQTELQARQEQYEYYRNKLLTFNETENGSRAVTWMKMSEICVNICSGGTPKTSKQEYYHGEIPWLRTQEVDWKDVYDTKIKISEEAVKNSSATLIPSNCVIVAMYGATAAKSCVNKIPLTTNQACCNLQINESKAMYKYVYHWLCKEYENLKAMGEGSQSNLNANKIKSYQIPIPPLKEQARIVAILDKFEALTNDLSQGLPAEIAAVQEQYEYYRDKLLSFPRNNKMTA